MKDISYISEKRIKLLHESINFLNEYKLNQKVIVTQGFNDKKNNRKTKLLKKLAQINIKRDSIISELIDKNQYSL